MTFVHHLLGGCLGVEKEALEVDIHYQVTQELWDKVVDINLKGLFFYTQAAAQEMMNEGHGGKIINIASIDALHPTGNLVHYDASKGGVVMVTKALALEFGPHNITVNAIAPGSIRTP